MELTMRELEDCTKGKLFDVDQLENKITNIVTDSRKVKAGDCFLAIVGERFDAHDFIEQVACQGVSLVIVSNKEAVINIKVPYLLVDDTVEAYGQIASYYKRMMKQPLIGITGSVGKTTTKDIIAATLSATKSVHKTKGNFNNEIGMPMTLLELTDQTDVVVLEMGMWAKGEISTLTNIAKPDIAVITNIGISHIERLKTQDAIFEAKMEIIEGLSGEGVLILNGDDHYLKNVTKTTYPNIIKVGLNEGNDLQAYDVKYRGLEGMSFKVNIDREVITFDIPMLGEHNVINALIAIAVGKRMKMSNVDIQNGLNTYEPSESRLKIIQKDEVTFIDDAYNASPDSVLAGLEFMKKMDCEGQKLIALGDMLELGDCSKDSHVNVLKGCDSEKFDFVFLYGDSMKEALDEMNFDKISEEKVNHYTNHRALTEAMKKIVKKEDVIYLKGSRGMTMEKIIELF